jgi:hypothetical protein
MRKILLLAFLVLIALIFIYRQRVFVRDPIGAVYRDEVKQSGVQVYINSLNDVLLIKDSEPGAYRILVQSWDQAPGTPVRLTCLIWTACLTEADNAPIVAMVGNGPGRYEPKVVMTNREVSFVDGNGAKVRVELK